FDPRVTGEAMTAGNRSGETEIRELAASWVQALRDKDVDARTAGYADDVVVFDVVNPSRYQGSGPVRDRLRAWLSTFDGPVDSPIEDLTITAVADVAFCHLLNHFRGATVGGGSLDMWVRYTVGFERRDGRWIVTHEHASAPFDPA